MCRQLHLSRIHYFFRWSRIIIAKRSFYSHRIFAGSNNVYRRFKLKMDFRILRPIGTCASEVFVTAKPDGQRLRIFERKILRNVFSRFEIRWMEDSNQKFDRESWESLIYKTSKNTMARKDSNRWGRSSKQINELKISWQKVQRKTEKKVEKWCWRRLRNWCESLEDEKKGRN